MDTAESIEQILKQYRNIAVVGFSADPEKPGRKVPKFLMSKGYRIFPVNPNLTEALGLRVYPSLRDIPEEIEVVEVFRKSEFIPEIVEGVIQRKKQRGDIRVLWLQEGIRNPEAEEKARREGMVVIADKCMYKEYLRVFGRD